MIIFLNIISIHAPHAGCDVSTNLINNLSGYFNPRTPCGVRHIDIIFGIILMPFQSTHPMRGATNLKDLPYFVVYISIHAPHAGCDVSVPLPPPALAYFNPRTPCGVRHLYLHACKRLPYFNPRTPCGVRREKN